MKTKLTTKTLAVLVCVVMVIAAFAAVAAARAEKCPQCGGRITTTKTGYYGEEETGVTRTCPNGGGVDFQYIKYRDISYTCSTAGCPETYTETKSTKYYYCGH